MSFRHGIVAYADSLDCVGVLGGTVDWVKEVFGEASITITI
jgi:Asp-tRNA(Asn)/Glu-tRNA(Gln) amidotransferase A subunit family amidase